ncbi:MAG: FHA domain-containing protein, partial [Deltaproteobacteria bacterium]
MESKMEMIVCKACGFENPPGQKYCEECAGELPLPGLTSDETHDTRLCPECRTENEMEDRFCAACGFPFEEERSSRPTAPIAEEPTRPPLEEGGESWMGRVKLVVEQGMTVGKQFILNDPEILIGREDEETDHYPDIDLTNEDDGYVHRSHARIRFEGDRIILADLGGVNRTY